MIAVTGANGALGQLVVKRLMSKMPAGQIVGLVRDPQNAGHLVGTGIELRQADYDIPESLEDALKGVDKLLLISSNAIGSRVPQHRAVIDAAKNVGVELLVYTSVLKADTNPMILAKEHPPTEDYLKASGVPSVILRNGWYTENYTQGIADILKVGAVYGAAQDGKFYTATRADYAEAAANVLLSPEVYIGETLELAGDSGFTLKQFAAEISQQTGKDIPYKDIGVEEFQNLLLEAGLPAGFAAALADSEAYAAQGFLVEESGTLSELLGRATTAWQDTLNAAIKMAS
jgi:NAD(P)H dehydrogenase (quinone)